MNHDRQTPSSLDSEEAVLGSLLIDPEAIETVARILKPDDFFRDKNRWIFQAMLNLYNRKVPNDQITVAHELARKKLLEPMGGTSYLGYLVSEVPTSVHVKYYAEIVKEYSERRELIARGQQMVEDGCNQTKPLKRPTKPIYERGG